MIIIKFNAKRRKVGNSYVITIPHGIAQSLDPDKEYMFEISELINN